MAGKRKRTSPSGNAPPEHTTIQVVAGSYERVLHGFTAAFPTSRKDDPSSENAVFSDTFLFKAHLSAVRCLALSPPSSHKRILATGSSDERVNLYALSTRAPRNALTASNGLLKDPSEVSRSRELGSLLNHSSTITSLSFPTHSKLLSSSNDNNIAITRTRDWTLLSTIHAPIPKAAGRPSGDTFAPGEVPAGINDLAVHPSARLAITVGIGERCMRLWDLVKGKKAGVLTFERELLAQIGEAKYRGGEARYVVWRPDGAEFAVAFEKGILIYDVACQIKAGICLGLRGRVCQVRYLPLPDLDSSRGPSPSVLAVSTEDGRILFYNTQEVITVSSSQADDAQEDDPGVGHCTPIAQIGLAVRGSNSRIKDFVLLPTENDSFFIVTAGSDGRVQTWSLAWTDLQYGSAVPVANDKPAPKKVKTNGNDVASKASASPTTSKSASQPDVRQVGVLRGTHETRQRITCLAAFLMDPYSADSEENGEGHSSDSEGEDAENAREDDEDEDSDSDGDNGGRVIFEGDEDEDDDDEDDQSGDGNEFEGFDD